ncbi:AMP-binding protein [Streptacidiphilus sp. PB12-B1b]|uniref:AMP-binding protein n=1 Tax=Streptacidiphilus sp. PB12-B1b TaxID=2705012 RepID=UPI0015FD9118|nr:AMP-binding protein [Streptacidiphilus sp. PB12-B1b]QMU74442.1 AMP-binding protein [Streptacidiphilus sp. PB12-B1b]
MPAGPQPPTLAEAVLAQRGVHRPGLVGEGFRYTQDEVLRAACARAALLGELLASAAHPHVGLLLDNTPEYVHWLQACALSGATAVGVNPTRRGPDLYRDIQHTDCAVLVTEARLLPLLDGAALPQRLLVVDRPGYADLLDRYRDAPPPAALPGPGTRMLLTFTSGSTGAPKAVVCSQRRLARAGEKLREQFRLTADDTGYACMPLFHGNALMGLWSPMLLVGGTVALRRRFSASHFLDDVRAHGACYFTYVGRAVSYVLATEEQPDDARSPLRLGFGTEAGAVDAARFEARFGCRLVEGYGSSEGGCNLRQEPDAPPGAVGRTGSGPGDDLAVVDPGTGAECPRSRFDRHGRLLNGAEAIGELVNRAARPGAGFEGYWRNPQAAAARVRDGWYWTGDLFHRDADGWFRFAGRSEDWLRVDSENLAVADIEAILARWQRARAVAVYAVPDPVAGDQVMAAVELRRPAPGDDCRELCAELSAFLAAQPDLGTKMPPRFVRLVSAMPVTATHKTARGGLREQGWHTGDPVLWRPYRRGPLPLPLPAAGRPEYRRLTEPDRRALRALFAEHGRAGLVGPGGETGRPERESGGRGIGDDGGDRTPAPRVPEPAEGPHDCR